MPRSRIHRFRARSCSFPPRWRRRRSFAEVEALRIFRRLAARDGFWIVPVLIGLDYGDADAALDSPAGFQDLGDWNMHRIEGETIGSPDAEAIARRAVKARLRAIRDMQADGPLSIGVFARHPPAAPCSLTHDFSAQFNGRKVVEGGYSAFEKGLLAGASKLLATFPNPCLVGEGVAPLPLGALVGAVYSPRAGFKLAWSQFVEGRDPQRWSFDLPGSELPMDATVTKGDPSSEDLLLAVGVSANIEHAVSGIVGSIWALHAGPLCTVRQSRDRSRRDACFRLSRVSDSCCRQSRWSGRCGKTWG